MRNGDFESFIESVFLPLLIALGVVIALVLFINWIIGA